MDSSDYSRKLLKMLQQWLLGDKLNDEKKTFFCKYLILLIVRKTMLYNYVTAFRECKKNKN